MRKNLCRIFIFFSIVSTTWAQQLQNVVFQAKMLSPLSASVNKKGDKFQMQVISPEEYQKAIIEAEVSKSKASGKLTGKSELLFSFKNLVLTNGASIPITADLTEVRNSKGVANVDEEGHVIGKSSHSIAKAAGLSALGAAIGAMAGGGKGAAVGAAAGLAVGLTIAFSTKAEDIKFEAGSVFFISVSTK